MSKVLRLDMHVHTNYSHDGRDSPRAMVMRAAQMGLDGLAITDHNTQEGVGEALDAGRDLGIMVIPGVEASCPEGHVLVYGSEDFGIETPRSVHELLDQVENNFTHCIAAPAHPFDLYRSGMGWMAVRLPFKAVETVNAHSIIPREVVLPMARRLGVGEVGGSDTHVVEGLGRGLTLVSDGNGPLLDKISRMGRAKGRFDPWSILHYRFQRRGGNRGVQGKDQGVG